VKEGGGGGSAFLFAEGNDLHRGGDEPAPVPSFIFFRPSGGTPFHGCSQKVKETTVFVAGGGEGGRGGGT